nr:hypothetical protein [uncultured Blautia sp.]
MRSRNRLKQSFSQFSYEHKRLDSHVNRVKKSAEELMKMLDNMGGKKAEKKEN